MTAFGKFDYWLCKIQEWVLSYSLLLMATILIGNFFARTIVGHSWTFAEEIGRFVLVIITFVGTTLAIRKGQHITMTAVVDLLPQKKKLYLQAITNFLTSMLCLFLTYAAFRFVQNLHLINMVSPALRIPLYMIYSIVPISMILSAFEYLKNTFANCKQEQLFSMLQEKE